MLAVLLGFSNKQVSLQSLTDELRSISTLYLNASNFHSLSFLTMNPREYRTALRLRTGHDTLPKEGKCKICKDGFSDKQGHHELSCAGKGRRNLRHNAIRDDSTERASTFTL